MVHLVTAVIKPHKLEEVKDALRGIGIQGMTIDEGRPPDAAGAGGEITGATVAGTAATDRHRLHQLGYA